jgi:hypothetical protein
MADDFTKRKFDWLDQVARDRDLSAEAFRLAYILASKHLNRRTGDAWPGQATLAETLGLASPRSIKHLIDQLAERGHLRVTVGRGRGHSNRYAPVMQAASAEEEGASVPEAEPLQEASLFSDVEGAAPAPEKSAIRAKAKTNFDPEFEAFWLQYPRKVGKGDARRAYEQTIRNRQATHQELETGAMRYAAECDGKEDRYIKHPGGWLRAERWRDKAASRAAPSFANQPSHHPTGAMSAIAGVADWYDGNGD